jgi:hypothetical protein
MAVSRPLVVAIVAMALLLTSVGAELAFHRTYALDVRDPAGWLTVAESYDPTASGPRATPLLAHAILANASDQVELRVRVDNGYPWSYSHSFVVSTMGLRVAEGTLTAPARDTGASSFTIPASTLLSGLSPAAKGGPGGNVTTAYLDVQVGSVGFSGSFQLQEVAK